MAVAEALEAAHTAPGAAPRASLRDAAAAVLEEWDDRDNNQYGLPEAIERLRAALATKPGRPAREPGAPRKPREGTKQEAVLTMLRRAEGATVAQITEATGWASHTVRGFLAGLKKKGIQVTNLERVRMVGPNKEGARGSFTIYHVAA
jgi:predicted ArsR family transcriptional regulator